MHTFTNRWSSFFVFEMWDVTSECDPVALCFAVSPRLRVQLQSVDVLPPVAVQAAGLHGSVRAVGSCWAGHQRSPCPGEAICIYLCVLSFYLRFSLKFKNLPPNQLWTGHFVPGCWGKQNTKISYYYYYLSLQALFFGRLLVSLVTGLFFRAMVGSPFAKNVWRIMFLEEGYPHGRRSEFWHFINVVL